MLYYMNVQREWWVYAILAAAHVLNRIPNSARPDISPFEVPERKKPVLDYLRVFGAEGFVLIDKTKRTKLDPNAHRCLFLGYAENTKGYIVWDYVDEGIVISHSIRLDERPPAGYRDARTARDADLYWTDLFDRDDSASSFSRVPQANPTADMEVDAEGNDGPVDMELESDEFSTSVVPSVGARQSVPNGGRIDMVPPGMPHLVRPSQSNLQVNPAPVIPPAPSRHALPALAAQLDQSTDIVLRPPGVSQRDDRLVFNGGSSRPRLV
jgi:hypothetical protein